MAVIGTALRRYIEVPVLWYAQAGQQQTAVSYSNPVRQSVRELRLVQAFVGIIAANGL